MIPEQASAIGERADAAGERRGAVLKLLDRFTGTRAHSLPAQLDPREPRCPCLPSQSDPVFNLVRPFPGELETT